MLANDFAGPPLGGPLFALAPFLPLLVDAASFFVAAALVATLSGSFAPVHLAGKRTNLGADIMEGLRWLASNRLLLTLGVVVALLGFGNQAAFAIFMLLAQEVLGVGEVGYGVLLSLGAGGAFLGSLVAGRVGKRLGTGRALLASVAVGGVTYLGIGLSGSAILVAAWFVLNGVTVLVWNVLSVSLRQALVPDALRGRVESVYRTLAWGAMPVGALLGGVAGAAFGLRLPFVAVGVLFLMVALGAAPMLTNAHVERALVNAATTS